MIDYYPRKDNVVADALSQKGKATVDDTRIKEQRSLVELRKMGLRLSESPRGLA